jgi:hypothetical protein
MDPSDFVGHACQLVQQHHVDDPHNHHHVFQTLLSTLYASDVSVLLKPAHEHTQPLWGPPDPYLTAGKSIAPSAKALLDMGIEKSSATAAITSPELSEKVQTALSKGWKVLDASHIQAQRLLPGFAETRGILPRHDAVVPEETPETFAAQVEWAAQFMNVIEKIPYAALAYGMIEFFLLRPNIDQYKEDIEDEPARAFADTVKVTGVRMGMFAVVAIVTLVLFGGG